MPDSWRATARTLLGHGLWPLFAAQAARQIGGRQGLVLMFHHIGAPILPGAEDYLFLSPAVFGEILDFVAVELRPLPPFEFLDRLAGGTLPPRATLLTFDDGTVDQVTLAAPEFAKRGLAGCFFVCPGLIGRGQPIPTLELATLCRHGAAGVYPRRAGDGSAYGVTLGDPASRVGAFWLLASHLLRTPSRQRGAWLAELRSQFDVGPTVRCPYPVASWAQLDAIAAAGMVVANHTLLHSTAAADGAEQFAADVADAFRILDARYPAPRRIFGYPYGRAADATEATEAALRRQGVEFAFVVGGGLARPQHTGSLALCREAVAYSAGATKLAALLALLR